MQGAESGRAGKFALKCILCTLQYEPRFLLRCPACGGALDARVGLAGADVRPAEDPERRYFDFLPLDSPAFLDPGLSLATPCRPAPRLGKAIGVPGLWVKDESKQPTGTVKDRLASIVLAVFRQFGIKDWVACSTGNSATALARAAARDSGMRMRLFCGAQFVEDHRIPEGAQIDMTVVDGDYAEAGEAAQRYAAEQGLVWEGGFFNWARREGLKLGYLESFDAMPTAPETVVQAVSSGMGMLAAYKAALEYRALGRLPAVPRMLMVQQVGCSPMAKAWHEGRGRLDDRDVVRNPQGIARAILLGDARASYPYLHRIATDTGGAIVAVSQSDIVRAQAMLADLEDLDVCAASAATVAALSREATAGRAAARGLVLAVLTGRDGSLGRNAADRGTL